MRKHHRLVSFAWIVIAILFAAGAIPAASGTQAMAAGEGAPSTVLPAPLLAASAKAPTQNGVLEYPSPTQELTVGSLGLPNETVQGASGTIDVGFPAPPEPLAGQGSLVRVFFAHSGTLGPHARLSISVNGHPLTSVPLDVTTSAGGVFEIPVPTGLLNQGTPNELEAGFELGKVATGTAYGQLNSETLLHYALTGPIASLASYPYSLLNAGPNSVLEIGILLPARPDGAELAASLALTADLARRLPGRRVVPQVLEGNARAPGSEPVVAIGRTADLPIARQALRAVGYTWLGPALREPRSTIPVPARTGVLVAGTWPRVPAD